MILISACLAGQPVRYNATDALNLKLSQLVKEKKAMIACPELLGGFTTPRPSAEIVGGNGADVLNGTAQVYEQTGKNVTQAYIDGAYHTLKIVKNHHITHVVLKENSPSCGSGFIYNGAFTGTKIQRIGVTTALLQQHGINVCSEHNFYVILMEDNQNIF